MVGHIFVILLSVLLLICVGFQRNVVSGGEVIHVLLAKCVEDSSGSIMRVMSG